MLSLVQMSTAFSAAPSLYHTAASAPVSVQMGVSKIASEETLAWYRAAELKHSRIAMAAATGWAYVASGGPLFPGYLSIEQGVPFESLGRDGYAAWDAVPDSDKLQIIGIVGILD